LQKKFHPDAFIGISDEEVVQVIRELSARINEAYNVLSNEKSRAEYISLLSSRFKGDARKMERTRDAEVKHQMGMVMLKKKDFQKAREYFNFAIQSDPECGEYKASMAWAIFADPKTERSEANSKAYALLLEALKSSPSASTHYYAGQVLKARDQLDEALFHFMRAVKLDPKHAEAQREVRLLSSRKTKDGNTAAGLLNKIFKR
jgi:tetratricopeptide (TPR) repeat protein